MDMTNEEAIAAHKKAFCNYLRKGVEGDLCNLETKALSVASDPDGGYLVSPQISDMIIKTVFETSPMRQVANVKTISSDALEILEDRSEAVADWTTESGAFSGTATPTLAKKSIPVHELYTQPKATQKLIDDSAIDIEAWFAEKISTIFAKKENTSFVTGDGVGKPRGILTYAAGTSWGEIEQISSGAPGTVTAESIIKLYYSLEEDYSVNASFLMNRATIEIVRQLKDSTGQYLWNPGLTAGAPDTLMGIPVYQAAEMPVPATDSLSIAVGDFKSAYQIVDRTGVRVLRDPFTDKPFVKFYSTKRVGGDVVNFEAIKLMKFGV
jgi:HK97 family phage major capsid protein